MEKLIKEILCRTYPNIPEGYKLMAKANDRPGVNTRTAYCYKWTGTEAEFKAYERTIVSYLRREVENAVRVARENGSNTAYFAYVKVTPLTQRTREQNAQWESEMIVNDLQRQLNVAFHKF